MKQWCNLLAALLAATLCLPASAQEAFHGKRLEQRISFSADGMQLRDALRMVVKRGGLNAVIDESIKGPVNVDLQNVPLGKALETLTLLGGLHCYQRGEILVFVSRNEALKRGLVRMNSKVFKIRFTSSTKLAEVINTVVFGSSNNQNQVQASGVQNSNQSGQSASADQRTNSLLVVGSPEEIDRASQIVQELDVSLGRKIFKLSNANAVQVASILNSSIFNFGPQNQQWTGQAAGQTGAQNGIDQVMAEVESLKDSSGGTANSSAQLGQSASNIRSTALASQKIDIPYRGPVVVPDSRTNSLIVIGTPEHIALAESLVNQLDRRLQQVAIDVEVVELTERGIKELGTGFSGQTGKVQYGFDPNGTNPGFSVSSDSSLPVASSFRVKLGALINDKLAKMLANPKITATDNTEAQLEIVDEVIKGTKISNQAVSTGTQNLVVVEPIFGVAGIILNILPKVGDDGFVTMRLHPTISNIRETMKDSQNNQITLLSRRDLVSQQVRVKNGSTLAIGGITQENLIRNKTKLPLLGDIPLLGSLFSWENSEKSKTELVILMTPRILDDQDNAPAKRPF